MDSLMNRSVIKRCSSRSHRSETIMDIKDTYITGLRNQHAVETQAIGTIQNEMPRMKAYPELQARM